MALIKYQDWVALNKESTAASRSFADAVRGLRPETEIVRHGMGGHRTEPLASMAFKKIAKRKRKRKPKPKLKK